MRASAIIIKNDKVLLIHRKKEGMEYWVFPGGSIEEGEEKDEAIKREVFEETSLKVINCHYSFDYRDEKGEHHPVFLCEVGNGKPKIAEGTPEAKKQSEEDWYHPEWIALKKAIGINIYPDGGKQVLKNLLEK